MRSLTQKTLSAAVGRLLAGRQKVPSAAASARSETDPSRRRGPSETVTRHELDSFRRAQGAAYWHYDRRSR
jgi:hypothetical protein